jgi:hypothetical protein
LNFEFSKVFSPSGQKYFINVFDQHMLKSSFEMKEKGDGNWEVVSPIPALIYNVQKEIIQALKDYLQH